MSKLRYVFSSTKNFLFDLISEDYPILNFIQVGAHRGNNSDDVFHYTRKHGWEGMLIEPVGYNFEKLKEDYKSFEHIQFLQCAIGTSDGEADFYYVKEDAGLDDRDSQVGAISRDKVLKYLKERIKDDTPPENYLVSEKLPMRSLESIVNEFDLKPHLLYSDAEGYDHAVIRSYDFKSHQPLVILYESDKMVPETRVATRSLLKNHKYILLEGAFDTLAISMSYWERRGFVIMEHMNTIWRENESKLDPLIRFQGIFDLVKVPGLYECGYDEGGTYWIKRAKKNQ